MYVSLSLSCTYSLCVSLTFSLCHSPSLSTPVPSSLFLPSFPLALCNVWMLDALSLCLNLCVTVTPLLLMPKLAHWFGFIGVEELTL